VPSILVSTGEVNNMYSIGDKGDPCGMPACAIGSVSLSNISIVMVAVLLLQKSIIHRPSVSGIPLCKSLFWSTTLLTPLKAPWTSKVTNETTILFLHASYMRSTRTLIAYSQDLFFLALKWLRGRRLCFSAMKENLFATTASRPLLIVARSEIGRKAFDLV
jgi:hypothetical protein